MDMFGDYEDYLWLDDKKGNNFVRVDFNVSDAEYNVENFFIVLEQKILKSNIQMMKIVRK